LLSINHPIGCLPTPGRLRDQLENGPRNILHRSGCAQQFYGAIRGIVEFRHSTPHHDPSICCVEINARERISIFPPRWRSNTRSAQPTYGSGRVGHW
jgi:hypothetical protein